MPPASDTEEQPEIEGPPSWKSTLPVGVPAEPSTVAVILTFWPPLDGLGDAVMLVAEASVGVNGGSTRVSSHRRSAQLAPPGDPASWLQGVEYSLKMRQLRK